MGDSNGTANPASALPIDDPDKALLAAMVRLSRVLTEQVHEASAVSDEILREVLADVDVAMGLLADLQGRMTAPRAPYDPTDFSATPTRDNPAPLPDDSTNDVIQRLDALVASLLRLGQDHDQLRQMLACIATLSQGLATVQSSGADASPATRLAQLVEDLGDQFVMNRQRMAYARALGLPIEEDTTPTIQLF